ncbi:hypothetical protein J6590_057197 [Homalodisca vitripennis]|nr:hypothetical protein J6590_057197 [Homalodisca vitripennis]
MSDKIRNLAVIEDAPEDVRYTFSVVSLQEYCSEVQQFPRDFWRNCYPNIEDAPEDVRYTILSRQLYKSIAQKYSSCPRCADRDLLRKQDNELSSSSRDFWRNCYPNIEDAPEDVRYTILSRRLYKSIAQKYSSCPRCADRDLLRKQDNELSSSSRDFWRNCYPNIEDAPEDVRYTILSRQLYKSIAQKYSSCPRCADRDLLRKARKRTFLFESRFLEELLSQY